MSRVRRVRYVKQYQHEDDNPYLKPEDKPRYFWRDWIEVETFKDADVQQLDGRHQYPGMTFQLRVPMTDPETGQSTDADGDRALLRIVMIGGAMDYIGGTPSFKGFVSKQELAHEAAYRSGDLKACLASYDEASDYEYVREEWQVLPRK